MLFGQRPAAIIGLQVLIGCLNLVLVYRIGQRIEPQAAVLGVLLLLFSAESILSTFFVLTETLYTLLLLLTMLAVIEYRQSLHWGWVVVAGLSCGLSVLCRPISMVFLPMLGILFALSPLSRIMPRIVVGAGVVALSAMVVLPWVLRNSLVIGSPTVSTISNFNLLVYEAAALEAEIQGTSLIKAQEMVLARRDAIIRQMGLPDSEKSRALVASQLAREIILSSPFRFIYVHLREDLKNLLPGFSYAAHAVSDSEELPSDIWEVVRTRGWREAIESLWEQNGWVLMIMLPFTVLLFAIYMGSILGIRRLFHRGNWFALVYLILPVLFLLLLPGAASNSRFRVPAMPFLCILASLGLWKLNVLKLISRTLSRVGPRGGSSGWPNGH
jgi:hypothetical protein